MRVEPSTTLKAPLMPTTPLSPLVVGFFTKMEMSRLLFRPPLASLIAELGIFRSAQEPSVIILASIRGQTKSFTEDVPNLPQFNA
jgi:hypothetical protein